MQTLLIALKILGAAVFVIVVLVQLLYWVRKTKTQRQAQALADAIAHDTAAPQYTIEEIQSAVDGYVVPECSQVDPSGEADLLNIADVREDMFAAVDRVITNADSRRHQLVLADSGMGKTSFCLNFFMHYRKVKPDAQVYLISLAQPDALARIHSIKSKNGSVIILDALDEDPAAIKDGHTRIFDILSACADFKSVIVTCRSQFFPSDAAIPTETGVSVITPRRAGQNQTYKLWRLYLAPFSMVQIRRFIAFKFPWYNPLSWRRRRLAHRLVSDVNELAARPMLLELLPSLVKDGQRSNEIYSLYSFMIDNWLDREERWISRPDLLSISIELAVVIHRKVASGGSNRVSLQELNEIALGLTGHVADWHQHLGTRSLLNRDSHGLFKFAHRSIMEYFFVQAAINGDDRCFDVAWTDFMKQLFISWGYTDEGKALVGKAESLLSRDLGKTELLPLSDNAPTPAQVTVLDFELAATRRLTGRGLRRSAPASWRKSSLIIQKAEGVVVVSDLDANLTWRFVDRDTYSREGLIGEYRQTLGALVNGFNGDEGFRLPSYAEFVSLIEGLEAADEGALLPNNELYLLEDVLDTRRRICVRLGAFRNVAGLDAIDKSRSITPTKRIISAYELSIFVDPSAYQNIRLVGIGVRVGCLEPNENLLAIPRHDLRPRQRRLNARVTRSRVSRS